MQRGAAGGEGGSVKALWRLRRMGRERRAVKQYALLRKCACGKARQSVRRVLAQTVNAHLHISQKHA